MCSLIDSYSQIIYTPILANKKTSMFSVVQIMSAIIAGSSALYSRQLQVLQAISWQNCVSHGYHCLFTVLIASSSEARHEISFQVLTLMILTALCWHQSVNLYWIAILLFSTTTTIMNIKWLIQVVERELEVIEKYLFA